jgi:hypothetical protein
MVNDKSLHFDDAEETTEGEGDVEHAPRARNRTVMLTPDITGQVRARLAKELDSASGHGGDFSVPSSGGFAPVSPRRSPEPPAEPRARPAAPAPGASESRAARPATRAESSDRGTGSVQQSSAHGDVLEWKKLAPVVGVLVTYDRDPNGEVYPLRSGRLIVTSEMPSGGNFLFLEEESVSSMHAIMRIGDDANVQVLDQLSEHGTVIARADDGKKVHLSGDKAEVQHGDKISFGERTFTVCILPPR